ncbi:MAG TPA: HU family DNA-binding protein [Candidatus Binatia bacterium]|jgi:integration host factor subunit beta|nr:HU family DNA-binding protein [Candidatus Binatia bacterium]
MTRRDLIREVVRHYPRFSPQEAEAAVKAMFDSLTAALARGERIEVRGFGTFGIKQHQARVGRDPRTGAVIAVPAKQVPVFRVAKALRMRVELPRSSPQPGITP